MQAFLLKATLQRKVAELPFEACQVEQVIELPESEFRFFQHNLLEEHDFLRDYNQHHASPPAEGVRNGVLVLSAGSDDGIFVCTEGYDYARYSTYVPNARQIMTLKAYPALGDFGSEMKRLADRCMEKALTLGLTEEYKISLDSLRSQLPHGAFHTELFLDMLNDRPEVENVDVDGDEILLTLDPECLPKRDRNLRTLTEEKFKIACAKHLLWTYGAGGEQADFSNCEFLGMDFSGLDLNSAVFTGSSFQCCTLHDASLCFAEFKNCSFSGCNCRNWTAEEADFRGTVFDHCDLSGAVMTHSDLSGSAFQDCEMEHASIQNSLICGMILRDAASPTLNMIGTTNDEAAWNGNPEQSLSTEELV